MIHVGPLSHETYECMTYATTVSRALPAHSPGVIELTMTIMQADEDQLLRVLTVQCLRTKLSMLQTDCPSTLGLTSSFTSSKQSADKALTGWLLYAPPTAVIRYFIPNRRMGHE